MNSDEKNFFHERIRKQDYYNVKRDLLLKSQLDDEGFFLLGVASFHLGEIKNSIDYLKKALEYNSHHIDAAICLSVLLNDIGKYDEAKNVFELAERAVVHTHNETQVDQKFALRHVEIADLYLKHDRFEEALQELSKALVLCPRLEAARLKRAIIWRDRGQTHKAKTELTQLLREHPQSIEGYLLLIELFAQEQSWPQVENLVAKANQYFPRHPKLLHQIRTYPLAQTFGMR